MRRDWIRGVEGDDEKEEKKGCWVGENYIHTASICACVGWVRAGKNSSAMVMVGDMVRNVRWKKSP